MTTKPEPTATERDRAAVIAALLMCEGCGMREGECMALMNQQEAAGLGTIPCCPGCKHGHEVRAYVIDRIALALATERARVEADAWRSGMEEAAAICDAVYARIDDAGGHHRYNSTTHEEMRVAEVCGDDIRARLAAKGE